METQPPEPSPEQVSLDSVWESLMQIAKNDGLIPLNKLPGLWIFELGDYCLSLNPHPEKIGDVEKFHLVVEWRDLPAGILTWDHAEFVLSENVNIHLLAAALRERAGLTEAATLSGEG
jgi:hypothetical protein